MSIAARISAAVAIYPPIKKAIRMVRATRMACHKGESFISVKDRTENYVNTRGVNARYSNRNKKNPPGLGGLGCWVLSNLVASRLIASCMDLILSNLVMSR